MKFELHIWGPAFGLPSIDPECIASVAYIGRLLDSERWSLVIAHDPAQSPTGDFPALYYNGEWVGGFKAIVNYLTRHGYSLDGKLSALQKADSEAIMSHLTSNALPLLDATLYASSTNYLTGTRPAWTRIVPTHTNFIVPTRRHEAALSRTRSLGLSSGSVDDLPAEDLSSQVGQEARMISSSPSLLFKKKQTLQQALKAQQSRNLFKLEALSEDLMEPLMQFLGDKRFLLSSQADSPNSVDCLALGYLSLLLNSDLDNNWVAETARKKYSLVATYVNRVRDELLPAQPTDTEQVMRAVSNDKDPLPWTFAPLSPPIRIFSTLVRSMLSQLISPAQQQVLFDSIVLRNAPPMALRSWTSPIILLQILSIPITTGFGYFLYLQTHSNYERHKRFSNRQASNLSGFGASAQLLSSLRGP